jgi:REP element-mobilizing transposase RayT
MARPLRIEYAGAIYHVTSRGDRQENIFHDDQDRTTWLEIFARVCSRFNWRCHAWCLMDNHYHILIETPEGNLSAGMRQLNGVYTQKSNRRHGQVGHVFQGRYKAILVEKDSYLLELSRYVILNPVRAGMVEDPGEWPWSSHLAMTGRATAPEWLETDWLLSCFSRQRKRAIAKYEDFVRAGVGLPPVWNELKHQIFLGGEVFVSSITGELQDHGKGDLKEVPRLQRRAAVKPLEWYVQNIEDAREGMALAYGTGVYTMKEIGQAYGVHYSTVSRAVRHFESLGDCKT